MIDLLSQVRSINDAPRKVIHQGITGQDLLEEAYKEISCCDKNLDFKGSIFITLFTKSML